MATAVAPTNNQAPTTNQATAYAELGSEYDPEVAQEQQALTQAQTAHNANLGTLQQNQQTSLSSLDQAKANAFTNNALTSNARGIMYSGYTPAQNTAYTNNTYNPNVQKVNTTYQNDVNNENTTYGNTVQTLQQKIADINQQRANDAYTLTQNTLQAQQADAKSAASAAKAAAPTTAQSAQTFSNASLQNLEKQTGSDGHISPETYASEAIKWLNAGYSLSQFNSLLGSTKLLNNSGPNANPYYNYALNEALKRAK